MKKALIILGSLAVAVVVLARVVRRRVDGPTREDVGAALAPA